MNANTLFSGSSRFSKDFDSVIDRAVAIASLPLSQLNSGKQSLTNQSSAVAALDTKFAALLTALGGIQTAITTGSYDKSLSNAAVAAVTLGSSVWEGSYTLKVTSLGSSSSSLSKAGLLPVTDPAAQNISASSSFTLTVAGVAHTITPASATLNSLAAAINGDETAGISATIVNIGNSGSPDYRLSLQSKALGAVTIALSDDSGSIADSILVGTKATYQLNGIATVIESDTRGITLSPGITADLLAEGESTITVKRSLTSASNALTSFANAYNGAVDELDKHRGQAGGALSGQSLITSLSDALRSIAGYTSASGEISSLTALGVNFDKDGHLSLDSSRFSAAATDKFEELASFLGTTSTAGFLKTITGTLNGIEDPISGLLKTSIVGIQSQITGQQKLIDSNQERVDLLRESLLKQFAAADSLIASLEQQVTYMTSLFSAFLNPQK